MNLLLDTATTIAETTATAASSFFSKYGFIILLVAMILIFYLFLYRPQKKQEKAQNAMRNNIESGDEITTIGGIIGKVISTKGETVLIETGGGKTKMRILKSAVRSVDVKASDYNENDDDEEDDQTASIDDDKNGKDEEEK